MEVLPSPQISHNSFSTARPIVAILSKPTHLQLTVQPNPTPVKLSQTHHFFEKDLYLDAKPLLNPWIALLVYTIYLDDLK
jgi:hypothetical protein